jgi:predicted nucleic acid-binding protein
VTPNKLYWDSVVFIDLIEQTPGRIDKIRPIIESAMQDQLVIVTSAFTMTEVVKLTNLMLLD